MNEDDDAERHRTLTTPAALAPHQRAGPMGPNKKK